MTINARLVDEAANIQNDIRRLQADGSTTTAEQIDAVANAVVKLALYIAERDGLKLTQP